CRSAPPGNPDLYLVSRRTLADLRRALLGGDHPGNEPMESCPGVCRLQAGSELRARRLRSRSIYDTVGGYRLRAGRRRVLLWPAARRHRDLTGAEPNLVRVLREKRPPAA